MADLVNYVARVEEICDGGSEDDEKRKKSGDCEVNWLTQTKTLTKNTLKKSNKWRTDFAEYKHWASK